MTTESKLKHVSREKLESIVDGLLGEKGIDSIIAIAKLKQKSQEHSLKQCERVIVQAKEEIIKLTALQKDTDMYISTMYRLKDDVGLNELLSVIPAGSSTEGEVNTTKQYVESNPELSERFSKHQCLYRPDINSPYCVRKLKTRREKDDGYCKICMSALEKGDDPKIATKKDK